MANAIVSSVRAQEFADTMIRQHGCHYDNFVIIPLSQRELARRYSISPGTVAWYLDVLGDRVITRRPQLTLRAAAINCVEVTDTCLACGSRPSVSPPPSGRSTAAASPPATDSAADDEALHRAANRLAALMDAIESSTRLIVDLLEQFHVSNHAELDWRVRANDPSERASQPRESLARSEELKEERKDEIHPLPSSTWENTARVPLARSERLDSRERADYEHLLAPLAELANRRQLATAGNRARLHLALDAYDTPAIEGAVARLCDDIRRGTPIRSPFGLLLHKAEQHDSSYFRPREPRGNADDHTSMPDPVVEPPDQLTALAEMALGEMDADPERWAKPLADLENAVDVELRRQAPGHADRLITMTPLRRAVRLDLYRARLADERSNT